MYQGKIALVTGGASGIGTAVVRRLAGLGVRSVVADVDEAGGAAVAEEFDGLFVRCDVRSPEDNAAAVACAVDRFGGLDIVALNAGVGTGFGVGEDFDAERYRAVMGINLDGVVYGLHAALPALRERGGGDIIATASLAALTPVPLDPIYAANKAAVAGLVRSLGPSLAEHHIRVNALCPGFADTAILTGIKKALQRAGMPILDADVVAEAFTTVLAGTGTGECWVVQPGRPSEPFQFRNVPGPRTDDGKTVGWDDSIKQEV
ncbi:SDR family NAD(P)-dependent oxidoreductase [Solihabitans fulvus]|uniref:SDR family NAD(P)-dependent oxidoreductase n=1 Tax=Solihabitans fulvus TaxID=1892852 RepID=A0A5B2XF78_9PSEU|nr:SDR family NAD(P)-dependent oxidoreductase [Solihabitans fulvus]KAA2261719.1 SDR family NAD(P)-dependent oxidoreductase [Solihabitans fulvus]